MAGVGLLTNSVLESTGSVDRFRETVKNGTYDATAQFTHMSSSAQTNANTVNSSYGRMKQEIETATKKMSSDTDTGFRNMVNSINSSRERAESNIGSLKNNIINMFSGAGSWLTTAGMNVITGFWNGLQDRFRDVQTWISSIGQWVADHKGPKEYDLGLLVPNGRWIMQSFETGLRQGFPLIEGAISDLTDMVQRESQFDIGSNVSMGTQAVSADQQGPQAGVRMFGQHDRSQAAQRDLNVILMLDKTELARAVYKLNADETQRVGVQLAGGYA
jgi:phage-related protein